MPLLKKGTKIDPIEAAASMGSMEHESTRSSLQSQHLLTPTRETLYQMKYINTATGKDYQLFLLLKNIAVISKNRVVDIYYSYTVKQGEEKR